MKAHIGVGSKDQADQLGCTNVNDKHAIPQLLHGNEHRVYGGSAYSSQKEFIAQSEPNASDFTNRKVFHNKGLTELPTSRLSYRKLSCTAPKNFAIWLVQFSSRNLRHATMKLI